LDSARSAC